MKIMATLGHVLNTPIGHTKTQNHSTNPFAPSTFKGNVLTADVFETKKSAKKKLTYSTLVGSIGDAFPTFRKSIESVVSFGNRMKKGALAVWNKIDEIGSITVDLGAPAKAVMKGFNSMTDKLIVGNYSKYTESQLADMLKAELSMSVVG